MTALTYHDLQALGLVPAVQAGPPGQDLTLVHEADVVTRSAHLLLVARHAGLVSVFATLRGRKKREKF